MVSGEPAGAAAVGAVPLLCDRGRPPRAIVALVQITALGLTSRIPLTSAEGAAWATHHGVPITPPLETDPSHCSPARHQSHARWTSAISPFDRRCGLVPSLMR